MPDSIEALFPHAHIVHTMHVVSRAQFMVLSRIFSCLAGYDYALRSTQGTRDGEYLHQRIVLQGIGERETANIRARLMQCDGVVRVHLEHLIQRIKSV